MLQLNDLLFHIHIYNEAAKDSYHSNTVSTLSLHTFQIPCPLDGLQAQWIFSVSEPLPPLLDSKTNGTPVNIQNDNHCLYFIYCYSFISVIQCENRAETQICTYPGASVPDVDILVPVTLQRGQCIRAYFQFPYDLVRRLAHIKERLEKQ